MKDAYYFSHDSNARTDIKIQALRSIYGVKGYGMYWILIEMMRDAENHKLPFNQKYAYLGFAKEFESTAEEAKQFIYDCIYEFGLFVCDENSFWSDSLNRRMEKYKRKNEIKSENGSKGGRPRKDQQKQPNEAVNSSEPVNDEPKQQKSVRTKNGTIAQCSEEVVQLTAWLIEKIKENNPNAKVNDAEKWRDSIRLLIETDNYSVEQVKKMIEFSQSDDFWKSNILSAKKLREKAGTLILQMGRGDHGKNRQELQRTLNPYAGLNERINEEQERISIERIEEIRASAREYENSRLQSLP